MSDTKESSKCATREESIRSTGVKCCAKCGTRQSENVHLSTCSRCLLVKYCSKNCQKLDWKRHKRAECNSGKMPAKASHTFPHSNSMAALASSRYRPLEMAEMKGALFCCWCCGRLVKQCAGFGAGTGWGDLIENPLNDDAGPFLTKVYGRTHVLPLERGKCFPVLHIMGEPGTCDYVTAADEKNGTAVACLSCATELQKGEKRATKHIAKCEDYLCDEKLHKARDAGELPTLSLPEKRLIARVVIEHDPNLSNGVQSTGGYMQRQEGQGKSSNKEIEIPYCYRSFEHAAFPFLLSEAQEFSGGSVEELEAYTLMRLYSVDSSWRDDLDYFSFSLFRLAAYGSGMTEGLATKLSPQSIPLGHDIGYTEAIQLINSFHY